MGTNSSKVFYIQLDQSHAQESGGDNDSIWKPVQAVLQNVIGAEGRMADSQNVASTLQLFMRSNRKEAILTSTPTYELLDP